MSVAIGATASVLGEVQLAAGRRHAEQLVARDPHARATSTGVEPRPARRDRGGHRPRAVHRAAGRRHHRQGDGPGAAHPGRRRSPSLDLVAYPLRHARRDGGGGDRRPPPGGVLRPLPAGARAGCSGSATTRSGRPTSWSPTSRPAGDEVLLAGDGVDALPRGVRRRSTTPSSPGPSSRRRASLALVELAAGRVEREEFVHAVASSRRCTCATSDAEIDWEHARRRGAVVVITEPRHRVTSTPMRRRHVRSVLRIEEQVYPRPWSCRCSCRSSRCARPACVLRRAGRARRRRLRGADDAARGRPRHDDRRRPGVAPPQASARGCCVALAARRSRAARENLTLEVRMSNKGAQDLYRRFGFAPVGVRKNYYQETNEDALVMWVHEVDTPEYARAARRHRARGSPARPSSKLTAVTRRDA